MSNKIDTSTIYEMFETIKSELRKQKTNEVEPVQIDLSAINAMTKQLENVIKEVKKPSKVEHRHAIEIRNNWFFFSWIALVIIILGLFWAMGNQRQTITEFRNNDLKYRYIRMQGQTNEENLFRLQEQFQHRDSVKIIRKQVEKYEELVKLQAERLERARLKEQEAERLRKEAENLF